MKTPEDLKIEILQKALKTQDVSVLLNLVNEALELYMFEVASKAFVTANLNKAKDQIKRQSEMIDNLNKTLFKKD